MPRKKANPDRPYTMKELRGRTVVSGNEPAIQPPSCNRAPYADDTPPDNPPINTNPFEPATGLVTEAPPDYPSIDTDPFEPTPGPVTKATPHDNSVGMCIIVFLVAVVVILVVILFDRWSDANHFESEYDKACTMLGQRACSKER
ncbi:MAG: hypothetical protein Q9188_007410 [Gyalolechia gomerana]